MFKVARCPKCKVLLEVGEERVEWESSRRIKAVQKKRFQQFLSAREKRLPLQAQVFSF